MGIKTMLRPSTGQTGPDRRYSPGPVESPAKGTPQFRRRGGGGRSRRGAAGVLALLASFISSVPAFAASGTTAAAFSGGTGTVNVGGTLYAKNGGALTLTVTTPSDTKCVDVTGAHSGHQTSPTAKSTWTFSFTAGTGDGLQTVTSTAGTKENNPGTCNTNNGSGTASYVLDNTGPVVPAAVSPAPNGAGWNYSDVSLAWTASDAGSGVASGPTPATDSVTANTAGATKSATATDRLGNVGSGSVVVKLDKTAPSIIGIRSPAANANGWNNSDVTVSFTCGDGLSGIKSCSGPTTLGANAANQSVTGTGVDNADNSASTTVDAINIDKIAPTLSGAATTMSNAAGWYNSPVTIGWTCADALSGIAGGCPANSTISGEGQALTATASANDRAGNTQTASSSPVNVDKTPPVTTASAPPAWNNTDVTVTLTANDALSAVQSTFFKLDGGPATAGTSVPIASEGMHSLDYWSTDKAGNVETAKSVQVKIDKSTPTIGHVQAPVANANGWSNTSVTVAFSCADTLSGIATCTAPQTVSAEGRDQLVTGTAVDNANNSATDPVTVSVDKTPPTISGARSPAANTYGWNSSAVTVTYACADTLSGVDRCAGPQTLGEGADQSASGTAVDAAGSSASATVGGINVDETAPSVTGRASTAPNPDGWYAGDVTIDWTCADNLSGIAADCPAPSTIAGEGANLSAGASVADRAGNTGTGQVTGVKIDRTVPGTSAGPLPSGWADHDVTVSLAATDNLSGVAATYYTIDGGTQQTGSSVTVATDGLHTVQFWSVDLAGNAEAKHSVQVRVDKSAPTIGHVQSPPANGNGWNNGDVTVGFACADQPTLSGLTACTPDQTVSTEGKDQPVLGTATDNAGNTSTDPAAVSIDKSPPTISGAPDRAANLAGWYADDVTVSFTCSDALSGIDGGCAPAKRVGEGADQSVTGSVVDNAGNTASTTVGGINVDKTAPLLSGAATTRPNPLNWHSGDVTITWSCDDVLSGIAGSCPADATLTGEGVDLRATAAVPDKAGNETLAASVPVDIDRTAPGTTASAPSGWVNNEVTVALAAHDALSGVASTFYRLDGGAEQTGSSVPIGSEGDHTLEFWSVDRAGNSEAHNSVHVQVDRTAPTITHALNPPANADGWNSTDVTVTFTCADPLSGVATCTGPQSVTGEGADQPVTGTAVDTAGNSATDSAQVSVDKTAPTITAGYPPANDNGWYASDLTVSFTCADTLSKIKDCTPATTVGEGADQSVTGTATDAAGNQASRTVGGLNVDETPPTLTGAPAIPPNADGWYAGAVPVAWTCADALSGIPTGGCPADSTISGEGDNLSASAPVADRAGNTASRTVGGIRIDRTAPTTAANAPAGWNNTAVTVSLTAQDGLSGVKATYYELDGAAERAGNTVAISGEAVHTLRFWSVDRAGNAEPAHTVQVKIDQTPPTIGHTVSPAPNGAGWNRTDVTVSYSCADPLSGIPAGGCPADRKLTAEGQDQDASATALDNAGNSAVDPATVSMDKTAPSITAAADRPANDDGWYADDVHVHYTCADALSGIGPGGCPADDVLTASAADQSATGTASDLAGNTASRSLGGIDIDKVAPSLDGAALSPPNPAGWYNTDVPVRWSCADGLSGIPAGACPGNGTISGEGTGLTAWATVSDRAGNRTAAASPPVKIDQTPPQTTASAPSGWTNNSATVPLTAHDNLSGVKATYYRLDSGAQQEGSSVRIDSEGTHTLEFWSVDNADNVEAHGTVLIAIDKGAPSIGHALDPAPNAAGWNNTNVTVTFTCADQLSGIASCTGPRSVGTEGQDQPVVGTAVDQAGNAATDTAQVSVDETAPTISGAPDRAPNDAGWYAGDVTIHYTCADSLSGLASCAADDRLIAGAANQSASGTATDAAGNTASATVGGINIDKVAPTLTGAPTTAANADGWYRGDVTVAWTCADALSGIPAGGCPAGSLLTGEGDNLSATASVADKAGNTASSTVGGVRIDRHDPSTASNAPAGWVNDGVTVTLSALDNLSGVKATYYRLDGGAPQSGTSVSIGAEGLHTLTFWSLDKAGNAETANTAVIRVDKTAPTITGTPATSPNANGWYAGPVTVHFTCSDPKLSDGSPGSGVAACPADATTTAASRTVTGTASDNAGNSASASVTLSIDSQAPTVTIGGIANGGSYALGAVPAPTCTATDTDSGLAGPCTTSLTGGTANGVGTFTYTASATDRAGNTSTVSATYRVIYRFDSFLQPINDTAHDTGLATSIFKGGSTVPAKFQLKKADGTVVQTATPPQWLIPAKGSPTSAAVDENVYTDPASSGSTYRWDTTGQQYIYNWSTKGLAIGYYHRIGVQLDDGQTYYVNVGLK